MQKEKWEYAIEVFSAIDNKQKLAELGDRCLADRQIALAAKAYEMAADKGRLSSLGDTCLREGLVTAALKAYMLAGNDMMVQFIKENFVNKQ